jgi:hypothetical protein
MIVSKKYNKVRSIKLRRGSLLWAKNKGAIKIAPWSNTHEIIIKIPYVFRIISNFFAPDLGKKMIFSPLAVF